MSAEPSPQETLAWERERRRWAGVAAIAAGVLTVGGNIVVSLGLRGLPKAEDKVVTVVDALGDAAAGGPSRPGACPRRSSTSATTPPPDRRDLLVALGTLALFLPLAYLYRATRARNPALGQWVLILLAIGAVVYGVGNLTVSLTRYLGAHDFLTPSTAPTARRRTRSPSRPTPRARP